MDFQLANELILQQEEMLQFVHFNNQEAWKLGKFMVDEISNGGIDLAVCIRKLNGNIVFQYATQNTSLENQNWMSRKFNTVSLMERSSLRAALDAKISNVGIIERGLNDREYVFCGGGFPIRIKGIGVVAVLTVSNLPHVQDHNFIVKCLSKYLKVKDVPEIDIDF